MIYRKKTIIVDNEILKGFRTREVARAMGIDEAYISRVRHNKQIVSEAFYIRLKKVLDNFDQIQYK